MIGANDQVLEAENSKDEMSWMEIIKPEDTNNNGKIDLQEFTNAI